MLDDGFVLDDKYRIVRKIGAGGMSTVYMATDVDTGCEVWAIKEVKRDTSDSSGRSVEQSLEREMSLLGRLDHPSIVKIVDTLRTDEYLYIVMDYVDGRPLDQVVHDDGPQSETDVQAWMLQVCEALGYLHSQTPPIIYRDMKPNNIMLQSDGSIKLIDLGVAREFRGTVSKDTTQFGTEGYAPPEQYGRAETDQRSDIYALGATMWHLLTGEAPQEMPLPNARTRDERIAEGFSDVIIPKCTQLNREDRYQNCEELAADLKIFPLLTKEYYRRQKRKVNMFVYTLVAAVIMLIIGFASLGLQSVVNQNDPDVQRINEQPALSLSDSSHANNASSGAKTE